MTAEPPITDSAESPKTLAGLELWASKSLDLLWLPWRDNWHNPSLVKLALPEAEESPSDPKPAHRKGLFRWFWRVDPAFGAWVVRAIRRAGSMNAQLPPEELHGEAVIREYLELRFPGSRPDIERTSALGPVILQGSDIITELVTHARYGLCPRWEGWEKLDEAQYKAFIETSPPPPPVPIREPKAGRKQAVKLF